MKLFNRIKAAVKSFKFPAEGGGDMGSQGWAWWNWNRRLPGSSFDYRSEAGLLWQNSIVFACMSFTTTAFNEAELCVQKYSKGKWNNVNDHPIIDLINNPNPFYSGDMLWGATIMSIESAGNSYWLKVRNDLGAVTELWYIPHWMIFPAWDRDGNNYITHYVYRVNGKVFRIEVENIVHIRSKFLDPLNPRMGMAPLDAALREICTDNEAATFMSAILRNGGFPGLVVCPADDIEPLSSEQRQDLKRMFDEEFTGDGRGGTLVQSIPIKIETPGYTPEQMVLEKTRGMSEERICACLELPPVVVHLGTGLRSSSAKASRRDAKRQAYDSKIIPLQKHLVAQVTIQLMPEFTPSKKVKLGWDLSGVLVLQEDINEKYKRLQIACGGPWLTPDEVRESEGYQKIEGGEKLREPFQSQTQDNVSTGDQEDRSDEAEDHAADKRD